VTGADVTATVSCDGAELEFEAEIGAMPINYALKPVASMAPRTKVLNLTMEN
jgi:hypothetical protein